MTALRGFVSQVVAEGGLTHRARRLGIDTGQEAVVYLRWDSEIVRSEGFDSQTRVVVRAGDRSLRATLGVVTGDLLATDEAGLSEAAWARLGATRDEALEFSHPRPLASLGHVRAKTHGHRLDAAALAAVVADIARGYYSDIHIASFLTACAGDRLDRQEIVDLTRAMVDVGERLAWPGGPVADKHSVGGLPGNRTTPIVVPIVAAAGLLMPKTSSRAITSPSGTADTMAEGASERLQRAGLELLSCNTIDHPTNRIDVGDLVKAAVMRQLRQDAGFAPAPAGAR